MNSLQQRNEKLNKFFLKIEKETYPEPISELHSGITEKVLTQLVEKYSFPINSKILDVGCGQGPALELLRKKNYNPAGIALNDEDVDICRSKGFEVYKMDQSFLEFEDNTFDFIWARHCIEHSIAPLLTLSEFYRVSKHDSYLYIEVPAPDTVAHHENNPNHYSVLSKSMWTSLISRSGFIVNDILTFNIQLTIGPDEYWGFVCKCNKQNDKSIDLSKANNKPSEVNNNNYDTDNFDYHFERARTFLANKDLLPASGSIDLAIANFHKSANKKYDIKYSDLLDIGGNLALANNNLDKAKKYFEEELKLIPSSSAACTGLGKVFFAQENYESAKIMFEWGVKNDNNNKDAVESLSKVNLFLGLEEKHFSLVED